MRCTGRSIPVRLAVATALAALFAPSTATAQTVPDADVYRGPSCFGTVMSAIRATDARILGSRDAGQAMYSEGDSVFVEGARGLQPGQEYSAYRLEGVAENPIDGAAVGEIVLLVGSVTVVEVDGDRAMARIGPSCGELEVGDRLTPSVRGSIGARPEMPEFDPVRLITPVEQDGTVVYGSSDSLYDPGTASGRRAMTVRTVYSAGDVVTVDRGSSVGWSRGAAVLFYETRSMVPEDPLAHDEPVALGQGYVIWAEADTVAILITDVDRSVALGARARLLR